VSLFDNRRHFRHREVILDRNLDEVDVVEHIVFHCLSCAVGTGYPQKFLLQDRFGKGGIETLEIPVFTVLRKFAPGRQDPRTRDAAGIDRVPQRNIAINAGVSEIADGCEAAL
jgi:hypothetical protein